MRYDFTSHLDRVGHDALAVDALGKLAGKAPEKPEDGFDFIPMWIADMNFAVVPTIQQALIERIQQPHFGYFMPDEQYYKKIIDWQATRNHVKDLTPECIGYENGVLGALVSTLSAFAAPGDAVLLHSPTYVGFTESIENAGFHIVHSPLLQDKNGIYRMDYENMEEKLKAHHIHVAVFCSPHNPTGRVWEPEEIAKAFELYKKYDCVVIADEIWSDIILPGNTHTPAQSISEDARSRTVALYAPSKTFNLSGLIGSYHIVYNPYLRDRLCAQASKSHYNSMNVLSMHALMGAYEPEGYAWLDQLREVLGTNVEYACNYITEHVQGVHVSKPQGTYMLFLDCTTWCQTHKTTLDEVLRAGWRVGVGWQDGRPFHAPCHIRMNVALPTDRVKEAFERLGQLVFC